MRHQLLASFCLCAAMLAPAINAAEGTGPASPIAVVNIDVLIKNAKLFSVRLERIQKDQKQAEAQLDELDKQEKTLKSQLDLLSRNKPEYSQMVEQLEHVRLQRKLFTERVRASLEHGQIEALASGFEEMRGLLKAFASEKGLKLVLQQPPSRLSTSSIQEVFIQLGQQGVLYAEPSLDITESFLAYLNARFATSGETSAPAPADGAAPGK